MELGVYSGVVVAETLREKLDVLSEIGYDFLELALRREDLPAVREGWEDELLDLTQKVGVPIKSLTWGGFTEFAKNRRDPVRRGQVVAEVTEMIGFARRLGAGVILLPVWEGEEYALEEGLELFREGMRPCAEVAEKENVKLALEHIPASKFCNTGLALAEVARAVGHDSVGIYYDIGNDTSAGQDPLESIPRLGSSLFQIHLKGTRGVKLSDMPLRGIRQALSHIGFTGRGAIEVGGKENNDHLIESLRVLRSFGY